MASNNDNLYDIITILNNDSLLAEKFTRKEECLVWTGTLRNGYAFTSGSKERAAMRHAYELIHGALDAKRDLRRTCGNRACVNPLHAEPIYSLLERFDELVIDTDDCIEWPFARHPDGYGNLHLDSKTLVRVPRYAYERFVGPIPEGMCVMHLCNNPPCFNPRHLQLGTRAENQRHMSEQGRARNKWTKAREQAQQLDSASQSQPLAAD